LAVRNGRYDEKFLNLYQKRWDRKLGNTHKLYYKLKKRLFNMSDAKFNQLVENCQNIPENKSSLNVIFFRILRKKPILALKAAKGFVWGK
jgi:flavin-dependent dehydrogenase